MPKAEMKLPKKTTHLSCFKKCKVVVFNGWINMALGAKSKMNDNKMHLKTDPGTKTM